MVISPAHTKTTTHAAADDAAPPAAAAAATAKQPCAHDTPGKASSTFDPNLSLDAHLKEDTVGRRASMAPSPCQPVTSSPWQVGKPATTTDCKCLGANVNGMRWCHGTESLRHVNVPDFTFEMDGKMPNFFNDKPAELHRNVLATERDEKEIDKTLAADRLDRLSAIGVPVSPGRQLSPLHKNHGITSEIEDNGEPPIWDNYQVRNPGAEDDDSASSDASSVCSTGELPPLDNIVNIDADLGFEVDPGAALTRTTNGFKQQGDADGLDSHGRRFIQEPLRIFYVKNHS